MEDYELKHYAYYLIITNFENSGFACSKRFYKHFGSYSFIFQYSGYWEKYRQLSRTYIKKLFYSYWR